ncbi:hypothetical protein DFS34DRAFT_618767 [Phlyctochytrium arcticum]|nr:hypothetical protein DFS34DRAFT_618767 [Phlyctochytrium arcticum]
MDIDAALNIVPLVPASPDPGRIKSTRWRPSSGHFARNNSSRSGPIGSADNLSSPPYLSSTDVRELGSGTIRRCASLSREADSEVSGSIGTGGMDSSPVDFPALLAHGSMDIPPGTRTSLPGTANGLVSNFRQTHLPVVRSRSSYSFQTMSSLLTISNLLTNIRKANSTTTEGASALGAGSKRDARSRQGTAGPGSSLTAPDEDGFLKEIGNDGFAGIWNHPITRCYYLMFLLWREYENLYYFRMDAQQFRLDFPTMYSSARKSHAYRIYNTYLMKTSPMFLLRRIPPEYQNVRRVIATVKANVDSNDATLYDDLAFMVLNWLEEIYYGTFDASLEAAADHKLNSLNRHISNPSNVEPLSPSPASPVSPRGYDSSDLLAPSFNNSAFYQAMKNDLRGTKHLTTIQYNRAAERITDMPPAVYDGSEVWEKLMLCLEAIGVDCEGFRARGSGATIQRRPSLKGGASATVRTRSTSSLDTRKTLMDAPDDMTANGSVKDWKRNSSNQLNLAYGPNLSHTFVQYTGGDQQQSFCEYCFKRVTERSGERRGEDNTAYRCESCGYVCHRTCRNAIRVACIKPSKTVEVEDHTEVISDKMQRVTEKMQAVQKEVDIEMKIRDGLDNLLRAKGELGSGKASKKPPMLVELDSQMERSNKKLDVLKHELQRCRLQLAALSAAAAAAAHNPSLLDGSMQDSPAERELQRVPSTVTATALDTNEGEVVRVVTFDSARKSESTKTFFITQETTSHQLIRLALEKFVLPGSDGDYYLSYTSADGDEVPLRHDDIPSKLGLNLLDTTFKLNVVIDTGTLVGQPKRGATVNRHVSVLSKEEETRHRKQRDILMEIIETEINYAEDLKNVVNIFYKPLITQGLLPTEAQADIFSNLCSLADIHEDLGKYLIDRRDEVIHATNMTSLLLDITDLFNKRINTFTAYETYCSNQHNARRKLAKLRQDPAFAKSLAACECNPKLQKLNLADLLVKPMHRITRYPILFKRLLGSTAKGSLEYQAVNNFINGVEKKVSDINEGVRRHEAAYRINLIDENLDFNNVVERFKLANGRRELISEKAFTYLKKNTNGTVEVIVLFFTDLVLIVRSKKAETFLLFKQPIPLEAAVFLDRPDADGVKNVLQIVHLQQEIHSLQTISTYDKNAWLLEVEGIRSRFCSIQYDFEHNILRDTADRYQEMDTPSQEVSPSIESGPSSYMSSGYRSSPLSNRKRKSSLPSVAKETAAKGTRGSGEGLDSKRSSHLIASQGDLEVRRTPSWAGLFKGGQRSADSLRRSGLMEEQSVSLQNLPDGSLPIHPLRGNSMDALGTSQASGGSGEDVALSTSARAASSFFRRDSGSSRSSNISRSMVLHPASSVKSDSMLTATGSRMTLETEKKLSKSRSAFDSISKAARKKKKRKDPITSIDALDTQSESPAAKSRDTPTTDTSDFDSTSQNTTSPSDAPSSLSSTAVSPPTPATPPSVTSVKSDSVVPQSPLDITNINTHEAGRASTFPLMTTTSSGAGGAGVPSQSSTAATSTQNSPPSTPSVGTPGGNEKSRSNKRASWTSGSRHWWTWSKAASKSVAAEDQGGDWSAPASGNPAGKEDGPVSAK